MYKSMFKSQILWLIYKQEESKIVVTQRCHIISLKPKLSLGNVNFGKIWTFLHQKRNTYFIHMEAMQHFFSLTQLFTLLGFGFFSPDSLFYNIASYIRFIWYKANMKSSAWNTILP